MNITCSRSALLAACQIVQGAVASRTTKPILSSILAERRMNVLTLTATDLDVGVRYTLPITGGIVADILLEGRCILPVARLVNILRESTEAEVTIKADGDTTRVLIGRSKYELPGGDPDEFPAFPEVPTGEALNVPAGVLRTMVKRTAFAAEKRENTRFAVTGIYVEVTENQVKFVATDTKRLAIAHWDVDTPYQATALIPLKAIQLLEKNLSDDAEMIRVHLTKADAMFTTANATIYTRLIEGKFPPYQQFIPKKLPIKFSINRAEFAACIRQAAITSDAESKRVDFEFGGGRVKMEAKGAETGSSVVEMDLPDFETANGFDIAFDPNYITDMLRAVDDEMVQVEVTEAKDRMIMRVGESFMYLVVPMVGG